MTLFLMKLYFKYYLTQNCSKKIAVVLSGCGVYDGSEVHEASACLAAITRNNIDEDQSWRQEGDAVENVNG